MFKRKVYDNLTEWKEKYSKNYAAMLEGDILTAAGFKDGADIL